MGALREEIKNLLNQGFSLIPVKEDTKVPLVKWQGREPLDLLSLLDLMERFRTTAIAAVLGRASRGIICLDVDVKYYSGFDGILFADLKAMYPEIWSKLKIEKTPSGGYHLLYRISGYCELVEDIPCGKLASRWATVEELELGKEKKLCFLEIKAEGGLTQMYPSPGYSSIVGGVVQELSLDEHNSLISWCRQYNTAIEVKKIRETQEIKHFYSVSPYEDFDNSISGELVLEDFGWTILRENESSIYYMRPDKKTKEVSAWFNKRTRLYRIYTSKTELEQKAYSPSNLKADLEYGGDKKALYSWLVSQGYGKIQPQIEKNIIRARALDGKDLPANVSEDGEKEYGVLVERIKTKYPHGIFWEMGERGWKISREKLYRVCFELGFRRYLGGVSLISGYFLERLDENEFYSKLKTYISDEEDVELFSAYEAFMQNSGKFTISRLDEFNVGLLLRSDKTVSYKFFRNCYVRLESGAKMEVFKYEGLEKLVLKEAVIDRDFYVGGGSNGIYADFLRLALGEVGSYEKKCIGFYAHDFRDEEGYMVLTTEKCENPKDGGGSGKNVFWSLLGLTSTFKSVPASMIKFDNNLFQSWNYQKIFVMSDLPKGFDLIFFKDIITGNTVVNKKYINEFDVKIEDMPKIGGSSNYSYDDSDPGIKRRVRALEFTNHFTLCGGVKKYFGKMFPKDWSGEDYRAFDCFILECIQEYLDGDCMIERKTLTEGGWTKQFEQKYSHLLLFFKQNIDNWAHIGRIKNEFLKSEYRAFCDENNIKHAYSRQKMNDALEDYCEKHGFTVNTAAAWKHESLFYRGIEVGLGSGVVVEEEKFDLF